MINKFFLLLALFVLPLFPVRAKNLCLNLDSRLFSDWELEKVTLKKGEVLEIQVQNPGGEWKSRGFQKNFPDVCSDREQPELLNSITAEIWYGANTWTGDVKCFLQRELNCFTPPLLEPSASGNPPQGNPLIYYVKASQVAGTCMIYFYYFVKPPSDSCGRLHYIRYYFGQYIEVTVE